MKYNLTKINYYLLLCYLSASVLFPALVLNKLAFILIFIINLKYISFKALINPLIILFIFSYGYLISYFNYSELTISNQFFVTIFSLFLIYPINKIFNKSFYEIIIKIGVIGCIYSLLILLLLIFFRDFSFFKLVENIFYDISLGSIGLRDFIGGPLLTVHIGCAPFMYLSYSLLLKKKKRYNIKNIFFILLHIVTILLTGSRALFLITILISVYFYLKKLNLFNKILSISVLLLISLFIFNIILEKSNLLDTKEESNNVKLGHVESYFDNLNLANFSLGEGLGSYYFSKGSRSFKSNTEITIIDYFRYLGVPLGVLFFFLLLFPVNNQYQLLLKENDIFIIFILYFIDSFTNPVLINSYGLIVVLWYWNENLNYKQKINNE